MSSTGARLLPLEAEHARQAPLPARFYERSSAWGYVHAVPPLAGLLACAAGVGWAPAGWKIVFAIGIALTGYRLTFVVHDSSHRTLFASRAENEVAGWLASSLLLISFPTYRSLHWDHHRHYCRTGDPQGHDYIGLLPGRDRVVWHLFKPLVLANVVQKAGAFFALHHAGMTVAERRQAGARPRLSNAAGSFAAIAAAQVVIILLATAGLRFPAGYLLYLGPLMTLGLFVSRVRSYLEHGALSADHDSLPVARTHPSNWLEANLLSGLMFNYHNEHHRWPQVPSRHLPSVHTEITAGKLPPHDFSPTYAASLRQLLRSSRGGRAE